jgi:hypothetical protein
MPLELLDVLAIWEALRGNQVVRLKAHIDSENKHKYTERDE